MSEAKADAAMWAALSIAATLQRAGLVPAGALIADFEATVRLLQELGKHESAAHLTTVLQQAALAWKMADTQGVRPS